ncbi:hypothetical protein ACFE04_004648 [Oxalis oulophora]
MFVGDSLSANQWHSLTCLLHSVDPNYTNIRTRGLSTFTFPKYDAKIKFLRNAYLVDIVNITGEGRVLELDTIQNGNLWKEADVLVFDSWHWWLKSGKKQPWDMIHDGDIKVKDMDRFVVYEKALTTWAKWVNAEIDPTKTKVFFQGVSPDHRNGSDWNEPKANNCHGQTKPLLGVKKYPGGPHPAEQILERVLKKVTKPVHLLNITYLSQLRKDAHPSVYGHVMDCTHWCLAGVPDVWNQLLYANLVQN